MLRKLNAGRPWVVILCHPNDEPAPTTPPVSYFEELMALSTPSALNHWFTEVSFGKTDLSGSRVLGWFQLGLNRNQLNNTPRGHMPGIARAAAASALAGLSYYPHILAVATGYPHVGNAGADVVLGTLAWRGQPGWRYCEQCRALTYWDGTRGKGPCVSIHAYSTTMYYSVEHGISAADGQTGWRWCRRCETLVHDNTTPGPAPCWLSGGTHDLSASFDYVVRHTTAAGTNEQANWKYCRICKALAYWDGTGSPGLCPGGGTHDHSSTFNYKLPIAFSASAGFLAHEMLHGVGLPHSYGPGPLGDFFNDPRPGAYGDATDVMSWATTESLTTRVYTPGSALMSGPLLNKMGWLEPSNVQRINSGSGTQTVTLAPLYSITTGTKLAQVVLAGSNRILTASFRTRNGNDEALDIARVTVHDERTLYSIGQDGWCECNACKAMVWGGTMLCAAGGVHVSSGSDHFLLMNVGPGLGETDWRWCKKCETLARAAGSTGVCVAGGGHDFSGSADYTMPPPTSGDLGWKFCNKCRGLTYGGTTHKGSCAAGGFHDHSTSSSYGLGVGSSVAPGRQIGWRHCAKCFGLFFADRGECTAAVTHQLIDHTYALAMNEPSAAGQANWKFCLKCHGLAFHDGSRLAGLCAAGGRHDHSASANYTLFTDPEANNGETNWYLCKKCWGLTRIPPGTMAGMCNTGGRHEITFDDNNVYEFVVAKNSTAGLPATMPFRRCDRCLVLVDGTTPNACWDGASHATPSSDVYNVRTATWNYSYEESYWSRCTKCKILMRRRSSDGSVEAICNAGGDHTATAGFLLTRKSGVNDWRWCNKCELLVRLGSTANCPGGGTHALNTSLFYGPPRMHESAVIVVHGSMTATAPANVFTIAGVTFQVLSMTTTSAMVQITA